MMLPKVLAAAAACWACSAADATVYTVDVNIVTKDHGAHISGLATTTPFNMTAGDQLDLTINFTPALDVTRPQIASYMLFPVQIGIFPETSDTATISASYELIGASPGFIQSGDAIDTCSGGNFCAIFSFAPDFPKVTGTIDGVKVHYDVLSGETGRLREVFFFINVVPEPTTWSLMIAGFGMVGATARRSRRLATN